LIHLAQSTRSLEPERTKFPDLVLEQWGEARSAYAEAVRARPYNVSVRYKAARFSMARGLPAQAVQELATIVRLRPEEMRIRRSLILALLAAGDGDGLRRACTDLLDWARKAKKPDVIQNIALACSLAPGSVSDPGVPVRLAEAALRENRRPVVYVGRADNLTALGAALYRAGRFEDAIRRFEEKFRLRDRTGAPQDWAFLAMAHLRLGHRAEAHRWLDRFRSLRPNADASQFWNADADASQFWDELEIHLLRSEAEAVVLYDPGFPANPFAP
jgi:tetratricopeptide (TPR) repeat protein